MDFRIEGLENITAAAHALNDAAGTVEPNLHGDVAEVAQEITDLARASAAGTLPGKLGPWVAGGLKGQVQASGDRALVKLSRPKPGGMADLPALNAGKTGHPTYGRGAYHGQSVAGGFMDRVWQRLPARLARRAERAVDAARDAYRN